MRSGDNRMNMLEEMVSSLAIEDQGDPRRLLMSISSRARRGVLVVDDTVETLKVLVSTLASDGHEVRPANSGKQALDAIAASLPELILLDVRMPEIDGYEVCRRLKEDAETRDIPVLFLSSTTDSDERMKCYEVGGMDFIPKPFHREELLARVRTHLELTRFRTHLEEQVEDRTQQLKTAILCVAEEYSEKEMVQNALQKSDRRYRKLIEVAPLGIFQMSLEGVFRYVNNGLLQQYECASHEEFLQTYYDGARSWADAGGFRAYMDELLQWSSIRAVPVRIRLISGDVREFFHYASLDMECRLVNGFSIAVPACADKGTV
jgi:DNA-binding response OmpR family regulator